MIADFCPELCILERPSSTLNSLSEQRPSFTIILSDASHGRALKQKPLRKDFRCYANLRACRSHSAETLPEPRRK